jgi:hypothetical protein
MERIDLSERLLNYAVRIVKLVESLPNTIIGKRIARSVVAKWDIARRKL